MYINVHVKLCQCRCECMWMIKIGFSAAQLWTHSSTWRMAISAPQPHCPKTTCSYWKICETISTLHISWCNWPKSVLIWEGVNLELRLDYKRLGKWNHEIRLGLFILKCANVFELNSVCGKLVWFQVDRMGLELGTKVWSLGPIFTNKKLDFVFSNGSGLSKLAKLADGGRWWRVVGYECSVYSESIFCSWGNERKESMISTIASE